MALVSKQLTLNDVIKFERLSKCANFWTQVQALAVCGYMMAHVESKVCVLFCTFQFVSLGAVMTSAKQGLDLSHPFSLPIHRSALSLEADSGRSPSFLIFCISIWSMQNCCFSKRSHSIFFRLYKDISFHKGKVSKVPRLLNWLCPSSIFLPC